MQTSLSKLSGHCMCNFVFQIKEAIGIKWNIPSFITLNVRQQFSDFKTTIGLFLHEFSNVIFNGRWFDEHVLQWWKSLRKR